MRQNSKWLRDDICGTLTVRADELAGASAVGADDAHACEVLVTQHLNSVIVAINHIQIFHCPVEWNAADAPELTGQWSVAPMEADVRSCVVLQHLQPAVSAVKNDDIAPVAIESDACAMVKKG
jgi:hypothetical protein